MERSVHQKTFYGKGEAKELHNACAGIVGQFIADLPAIAKRAERN